MRRDERVVLLSCLAILFCCAGINYARWRSNLPLPPVFVDAPDKAQASGNKGKQPGRLVAHVTGAVRNPGVYTLPTGARVADALRSAGGTRPDGEPDALNLAAPVQDGQQIIVRTHEAKSGIAPVTVSPVAAALGKVGTGIPAVTARAKSKKAPAAPVNVNRADAAELQTLPGVGPSLAQNIIIYRQQHGALKSLSDLDAVKGIGPKKLEKLSPYVRF